MSDAHAPRRAILDRLNGHALSTRTKWSPDGCFYCARQAKGTLCRSCEQLRQRLLTALDVEDPLLRPASVEPSRFSQVTQGLDRWLPYRDSD